ncbi:MAG: ABC transporter substrate-binding protein, partial [Candidatus Thorarchaeota archaeon]
EVIDDYTIRFVLSEPYPPFIPALSYSVGSMMSPSYCIAHASNSSWASWDMYGVDFGESENWMDSHACGTGPYMLTEIVHNQYTHLTRYDNYWRATVTDYEIAPSNHAGSIEEVYIKANSDVYGRILNLRIGETDSCYWPTTNAHEIWDSTNEISLDPNIYVSTGGLTFDVQVFGFNMDTINTTEGVLLTSPFKFKNFRRAASFAFDYEQFLDGAMHGFGVQGKGPIPQGMVGHNGSMYNFQNNITAAIEEWNLAMSDSDFVHALNEMDNQIKLKYSSNNAVAEYGSVLLAEGLTNMLSHPDANLTGLNHDMEFTTQARNWPAYIDDFLNGRIAIFFLPWIPDYADPDNYIWPFCYQYGSYALRIGYNNTEVNIWYVAAKTETDPVIRQKYFNQIQEIVADDCPYIWVCQSIEFRVRRSWLKGDGLVFNAMHGTYFYEVYKDYS